MICIYTLTEKDHLGHWGPEKDQSPINQGMLLLGSNHFLRYIYIYMSVCVIGIVYKPRFPAFPAL